MPTPPPPPQARRRRLSCTGSARCHSPSSSTPRTQTLPPASDIWSPSATQAKDRKREILRLREELKLLQGMYAHAYLSAAIVRLAESHCQRRVNWVCYGSRWGARGGDGAPGCVVPVPLLRRVRGPSTAPGWRWWGALGWRGAEEEVSQTRYGFGLLRCASILKFLWAANGVYTSVMCDSAVEGEATASGSTTSKL